LLKLHSELSKWYVYHNSGQGPRHTKDVIKMVPVVPLFNTDHSKGKLLALSQELR